MALALDVLETAITQLSEAELMQFRRWFAQYDGDVWDEQIERDAAAGKLDSLAIEALADYHSGAAREI
jgi:succinate dehydrogenase flavin-adding protein (antitoxin of CptAB toxin-antitoxin module)